MRHLLNLIDDWAGRWLEWRYPQPSEEEARKLLGLKELHADEYGMEIVFDDRGTTLTNMAKMFASLLLDNDAPNYVEMRLHPRPEVDMRSIVVTAQWADRYTPHQIRMEMQKMLERAAKTLEPGPRGDPVADLQADIQALLVKHQPPVEKG